MSGPSITMLILLVNGTRSTTSTCSTSSTKDTSRGTNTNSTGSVSVSVDKATKINGNNDDNDDNHYHFNPSCRVCPNIALSCYANADADIWLKAQCTHEVCFSLSSHHRSIHASMTAASKSALVILVILLAPEILVVLLSPSLTIAHQVLWLESIYGFGGREEDDDDTGAAASRQADGRKAA
jgi:hypothetical protein